MSYEYHESYKHKLAKELLYSWLLNCEKEKGFCPKLPFGWRTGNYGVFMELPFYETSDPYYFENSKGLIHPFEVPNSDPNHQDNFYKTIDRGRMMFVPDICIFHKGEVKIIIELVHKSPVTEKKINSMMNFFGKEHSGFELWEIEAENVLVQTNLKCELDFFKVIDTWSWSMSNGNTFSYSEYLAAKRNKEIIHSLLKNGIPV